MDRPPRSLRALTAHVTAYRFQLENERMRMARLIEIKGLGADIAGIKAGISTLRAAAAELNTEKAGLTAEIKDLTEQLKQHRADLRFEAETLGNSSGDTDEGETKPPPKAPAIDPGATVTDTRVALGPHPDQVNGQTTFRTEAEKQIAAATKS